MNVVAVQQIDPAGIFACLAWAAVCLIAWRSPKGLLPGRLRLLLGVAGGCLAASFLADSIARVAPVGQQLLVCGAELALLAAGWLALADFGRRRLVAIRLADPGVFLHREEPILEDGRIVGAVSSGAFGHRIEASLGLGWITLDEPVTAERLAAGRFAVEVAGEPVPATLSLCPFYDPSGSRVRG